MARDGGAPGSAAGRSPRSLCASGRLATPDENVPYGVAIAVGALMAFPQSPLAQLFQGLS